MTVKFDERKFSAESAIELIEIIKPIRWDAELLPTPESYIDEMARTYKFVMHRKLRLPRGSTEHRAREMFKKLAEIGIWEYIEEE